MTASVGRAGAARLANVETGEKETPLGEKETPLGEKVTKVGEKANFVGEKKIIGIARVH